MESEWQRLLRFAALSGHVDVAALAIGQGASADREFDDGRTALVLAAEAGHLNVVRLLLARGARVGAISAFLAASANGHADIVKELNEYALTGTLELQVGNWVPEAAGNTGDPPDLGSFTAQQPDVQAGLKQEPETGGKFETTSNHVGMQTPAIGRLRVNQPA